MPTAVVLSHRAVAHELGPLGDWLEARGFDVDRLHREDEPELPDAADLLVVLGSPGTGATTALVEAVAARLAEGPASRILVIARDREAVRRTRAAVAQRAPQGTLPTVTTFHGLAYSLVPRPTGPGPDEAMPRLLSGAEEDARIRELLRGAIADGELPWPDDLLAATSTLGFANDLRAMLARARELGLDPSRLEVVGRDVQHRCHGRAQ